MIELHVCEECMEMIEYMGLEFRAAYVKACVYYIQTQKKVKYSEKQAEDFPESAEKIRLLEEYGFILTTEISEDEIGVFPKGHQLIEEGHYFCSGVCKKSKVG
jgi:hypothetical protein